MDQQKYVMVFLCLNVNRLFELLLVKSIYTGCLIFVDIKEVNEWENVNYHPIKLVFDEHHFQFIRTSDKLCITSSSSSRSIFLSISRMNSEQKINFYNLSSNEANIGRFSIQKVENQRNRCRFSYLDTTIFHLLNRNSFVMTKVQAVLQYVLY